MPEELIEFLEALEKDEQFFQLLARVTSAYHKALRTEGFTEDQATRIVASQNFRLSST